jgi:hypothetical protein
MKLLYILVAALLPSLTVTFQSHSSTFTPLRNLFLRKAQFARNSTKEVFHLEGNGEKYIINRQTGTISRVDEKTAVQRNVLDIRNRLQKVFLPSGYPDTVPPEYINYQKYDLLQDLTSYLRNIMATHAILVSLGVGTGDVTPFDATVKWILRDGISLIAGLIFTTLHSQQFGINAKKWRFFADFIVDVGITFEMIAPSFPRKYFLLFVSLGSICKALCGIAAGTANASIFQYFSLKHNNLSDIIAKNQAQHTVVTLLGLFFVVMLSRLSNLLSNTSAATQKNSLFYNIFKMFNFSSPLAKTRAAWTVYGLLTLLHLFCNYRAMKLLAINTFNTDRYREVIHRFLSLDFIRNVDQLIDEDQISQEVTNQKALFSPKSINKAESIFFGATTNQKTSKLPVLQQYTNLQELLDSFGDHSVVELQNELRSNSHENYLLLIRHWLPEPTAAILYHKNCSTYDQAKALLELEIIAKYKKDKLFQSTDHYFTYRTECKQLTSKLFPIFWRLMNEIGWNFQFSQLKPVQALTIEWKE